MIYQLIDYRYDFVYHETVIEISYIHIKNSDRTFIANKIILYSNKTVIILHFFQAGFHSFCI